MRASPRDKNLHTIFIPVAPRGFQGSKIIPLFIFGLKTPIVAFYCVTTTFDAVIAESCFKFTETSPNDQIAL